MVKSRPKPRAAARKPRGGVLPIVLILLAGIAAYSNSFGGVLVFDDEPALAQNPHLRQLWPLTDAMTAPAGTTLSGRPVAALTFAIDHAMSVEPLAGYHRTNLVIHLAAALLVFGIIRGTLLAPALIGRFTLAPATRMATIVALLFVVHPLQTGAVTYLIQRVESLMGLFYLATLYAAIRAWDASGRARMLWTCVSVLACALGMGTKETMVTAPVAVMLWDWHFAPVRVGSRRGLYAALASTWILLAILVAGGHRSSAVGFGFADWPWWSYLMTQASVLAHYIRLVFVPSPLVLDYDWPASSLRQAVLPAAVLAALLGITFAGVVRRRPAAFAGACCFLILAPSSSVIPIRTEVAAEHRMYLPLAAIAALAVAGAFWAGRHLAGGSPARQSAFTRAGLITAAAVVVLFGYMTYQRNALYQDYDRIWVDTIAKRPDNVRARNNYATSLLVQGRFAEAEPHLRVAAARPGFAEAEMNLGVALSAQGKLDEGVAHLRRAVALQPDYADAHRNLGESYLRQHRPAEAVAEFSKALDSQPDNVDVLNRAAWILATAVDDGTRDGARARAFAERAVALTGRRNADSLDNLGVALAETGQFEQATAVTLEAIALARSSGQAALVSELEHRLIAYGARQPIRVP